MIMYYTSMETYIHKSISSCHNSNNFIINQQNYRILKADDVRQRIEDDLCQVSLVLSIPKSEASILLCYFNWSVTKLIETWFSDECGVREKVGLLHKPILVPQNFSICGICFDSFSRDMISSVACGHPYCNDCWSNYISTCINNDVFGCLLLKCPDPSCHAAVDRKIIDSLGSIDDRKKYDRCIFRSYIELKRNTRWCLGRDCDCAIEFCDEETASFDVTCHCFTSFCWNCNQESHRPVDCETVKKWNLKNSSDSESENVKYILTYCKPCPNCKIPIEKNGGCMNMRCRVCGHSFCWLCLASCNTHGRCNGYLDNVFLRKKEMGNQSKYMHYFERWEAHRRSKMKALADFKQVKDVKFRQLSQIYSVPESNFDFLTKAWLQIVECRRVLEWSYVYGYYMAENELVKKEFFEYLQGEAETGLERLQNCAEKELEKVLDSSNLSMDLIKFQKILLGLTVVTGNYFEKLVKALENGLPDVMTSARE